MDFQDVETRGHPSEPAMEAAPFGEVPRIGAPPVRVRDYRVTISSPRILPIRGVSDSASQRAQAKDLAETSTPSPRNLPIREVSESDVEKAQDQDVRFQQAIEMADEVTRGLGPEERDVAFRRAMSFVFHPTPLQAETSRGLVKTKPETLP
jgi:hypothetical protein